ncbi:hypothetical protein GCM10010455_04550 [Microbacterium esteraromaticum]
MARSSMGRMRECFLVEMPTGVGEDWGILQIGCRIPRATGDGSSAAGSLSASAVGARRADDHLSRRKGALCRQHGVQCTPPVFRPVSAPLDAPATRTYSRFIRS